MGQVTDRADYIGSSDIAGILGISPWRTPFDIWAEHVHDPSWQPQEETIQMRVGTYMETFLADEYERETGRIVGDRQMEHIHPDYPFLRVHVDGWSYEPSAGRVKVDESGVWEGKTAGDKRDWGTVEEPLIPEHYQAQCFFALGLTKAKWCDVSVLLPRGDFRTIRLEADEPVQNGIIAKAVAFKRDYIDTRTPPPIDTSEAARRWLARVPDDDEDALEAGADLEEVIEKLAGIKIAAKSLESTQELLENQAKHLIGEHQKAIGRGWHVSYKRTKPFPQTKWKEAARSLVIEMQLHGLADEADRAIGQHTEMVENRRPFILKKEEEA